MEIGKSEGKERGERRKRVIPGRDARSNNPREIRHGRLTASFDDSFSGRERASSLSRHSRPFSPFYFSIFLSILFFPPPPRAISALPTNSSIFIPLSSSPSYADRGKN